MTTYVDTNIIVYAFGVPGHPLRTRAQHALGEAARDGPVATSFLAIDELVWTVRRLHGRTAALRAAEQAMDLPFQILPIGEAEGRRALALMRDPGLKPHDATHAAAALEHGCARILSTDADFDAVAGLERIGLG